MPNVFTLFGELIVENKSFKESLYDSETRLKKTEKALTDTEKKVESFQKTLNKSTPAKLYDSDDFKKRTEAFKKGIDEAFNKTAHFNKVPEILKKGNSEISKAVSESTKKIDTLGVAIGTFAGTAGVNVLASIAGYLTQSISLTAQYGLQLEALNKKFANIIGNAQTASQHLLDLRIFSLTQGVDENWVIGTAKSLERLKVPASQVLDPMKAIGDSVAGTGGSQNDKEAVTSILSNVIKTRHASLETINSLRDVGITDIWQQLRQETGKTNEELYNLAKTGRITSDTFIKAYQDMAKVKFSNKMKEESETLSGSLMTLANAWKFFLVKGFSDAGKMINQGDWIGKSAKWMKERVAQETKGISVGISASLTGFNIEEYEKQLEAQKLALSNYYKDRLNTIGNSLKIEFALLDSHVRLTDQAELTHIQKSKALKDSAIRSEISAQTQYYNKQIAFAQGDANEVAKLTAEKNQAIKKLNTDLRLNEIDAQKQTAQAERKILEQRRQNYFQYKQSVIKEISQVIDKGIFNFNRNINFGNDNFANFEKLRNLTISSFELMSKTIKEQYGIQLQNERLTIEERVNLNRQMFLDIQDLAEKNRQRLIQISDDQYKEQVTLLETFQKRISDQYDMTAKLYGSLGNFFNPDSFNTQAVSAFYQAFYGEIDKIEEKPQGLKIRENLAKDILGKGTGGFTTVDQFRSYTAISEELSKILNESTTLLKTQDRLKNSVSGVTDSLLDLANAMTLGTTGANAFDLANKKILESQHRLQTAGLESEIDLVKQLIELTDKVGDKKGFLELSHRLQMLTDSKQIQQITQAAESLNLYKKSIAGLEETLNNLKMRDPGVIAGIRDSLTKDLISQKINKETEQIRWEIKVEGMDKWQQIYQRIKDNFGDLANHARTTTQILGDSLSSVFDRVNQIFTSAATSTEGFFKTILDGFKQFIKQVIAEMIALLVVSTVVGLIQGAFGGQGFGAGFKDGFKSTMKDYGGSSTGGGLLSGLFGGGSSSGSGNALGNSHGREFSLGGFTGQGGKYDPAGTVHKGEFVFDQEATKFWGVGNLAKMLNFQMPNLSSMMPQMSFAGGGYVGGMMPSVGATTNNKTTQIININVVVPNARNPEEFRQSETQIKRQIMKALQESALKDS